MSFMGKKLFFTILFLRVSGPCETDDAEADRTSAGYSLCAGQHGGACCDDIVNQQDVAAFQILRMFYGKDVPHVFSALPFVQMRLAGIGDRAYYTCGVDGESRAVRNAL